MPTERIFTEPDQPSDPARIRLYGMVEHEGYRLYEIPATTPVSDVVIYFRVGSHGAIQDGTDSDELVRKVAAVTDRLAGIIPVGPFFADAAGLKLRFLRRVSDVDFSRISALFPEDDICSLGLERYIAEWDGESPILEPIIREGFLHLWWD